MPGAAQRFLGAAGSWQCVMPCVWLEVWSQSYRFVGARPNVASAEPLSLRAAKRRDRCGDSSQCTDEGGDGGNDRTTGWRRRCTECENDRDGDDPRLLLVGQSRAPSKWRVDGHRAGSSSGEDVWFRHVRGGDGLSPPRTSVGQGIHALRLDQGNLESNQA